MKNFKHKIFLKQRSDVYYLYIFENIRDVVWENVGWKVGRVVTRIVGVDTYDRSQDEKR